MICNHVLCNRLSGVLFVQGISRLNFTHCTITEIARPIIAVRNIITIDWAQKVSGRMDGWMSYASQIFKNGIMSIVCQIYKRNRSFVIGSCGELSIEYVNTPLDANTVDTQVSTTTAMSIEAHTNADSDAAGYRSINPASPPIFLLIRMGYTWNY